MHERDDAGEGLRSHTWAASYLDVPAATLHSWNSRGIGPKSYRLGKHRKYRVADLDRFIEGRATSRVGGPDAA